MKGRSSLFNALYFHCFGFFIQVEVGLLMFHGLLLCYFCLFFGLFFFVLGVFFTLRGMSFPDNFEDFVWIIGGNGRFSIFAFDFELYELGFLFPIVVQGEPVVQVLGREAPAMVNSF